MSNSPYTVHVTDENGATVFDETIEINEGDDLCGVSVQLIITRKPKLPSRSPLHPKALNIDDLEQGLNIRRHNKNERGDSNSRTKTMVNGEPFKRGDKYGQDDSQAHTWMVPVITTDYSGKLVQVDLFLADMGVVPYESRDGSHRHWNDQNYTLAE